MKVKIIENPKSDFESLYLTVREKESRVYTDEKVIQLPYLEKGDAHYQEWKLRAKTLERFLSYLTAYKKDSRLLEVGCGNGWFSNQCTEIVQNVKGIDVNNIELEQARRVFQRKNISFHYWDIFAPSPFQERFDCIVLNAVIQYFPTIGLVLDRLKDLLNPHGEIHILDSPFYTEEELVAAKKGTYDYYNGINIPEMITHYFHHLKNSIEDFDVLFQPSRNRIARFMKGKDSPFGWYRWKI